MGRLTAVPETGHPAEPVIRPSRDPDRPFVEGEDISPRQSKADDQFRASSQYALILAAPSAIPTPRSFTLMIDRLARRPSSRFIGACFLFLGELYRMGLGLSCGSSGNNRVFGHPFWRFLSGVG